MADPTYGSEVHPQPPLQDMNSSIQLIAGTPGHDRNTDPATYTGGMGGQGLGGSAEGTEAPAPEIP
jgi:hypothetical protein